MLTYMGTVLWQVINREFQREPLDQSLPGSHCCVEIALLQAFCWVISVPLFHRSSFNTEICPIFYKIMCLPKVPVSVDP